MSTTYLEVVNEVLSELNEVALTASNFTAAKNIQLYVKHAINRAYFDINNPEHKWPWLAVAAPQDNLNGNTYVETVAGTRWYLLNPLASDFNGDYGHIDWDSFYLTTEGVAGESAPYANKNLKYILQEDWQRYFAKGEGEDKGNSQVYGEPVRVMKSNDGRRFGLSPIPKQVYRIYFYAWSRPTKLVADTDTVTLPDQFIPVLVSRARYYAWQRKENPQQAAIALEDYKKGIRGMRSQTIDSAPNYFTDDRVRF